MNYLLIHIPGNQSENCYSRQVATAGSPAAVWVVLLGDKQTRRDSKFSGGEGPTGLEPSVMGNGRGR